MVHEFSSLQVIFTSSRISFIYVSYIPYKSRCRLLLDYPIWSPFPAFSNCFGSWMSFPSDPLPMATFNHFTEIFTFLGDRYSTGSRIIFCNLNYLTITDAITAPFFAMIDTRPLSMSWVSLLKNTDRPLRRRLLTESKFVVRLETCEISYMMIYFSIHSAFNVAWWFPIALNRVRVPSPSSTV